MHRSLTFTVQSNIYSIKQERSKQLSDPTLTVWKLHHFNVACGSTNKSRWMGDGYLSDQFGITALHFTGSGVWCKDTWMQNQLKSIKPELLAPALGGGRGDSGWRQRMKPPCWMFHAPGCRKSYCSGMEQRPPAEAAWALTSCEFALQQPGAREQRVSTVASPAGPKPSLCQVVQVSVCHASGVLHY